MSSDVRAAIERGERREFDAVALGRLCDEANDNVYCVFGRGDAATCLVLPKREMCELTSGAFLRATRRELDESKTLAFWLVGKDRPAGVEFDCGALAPPRPKPSRYVEVVFTDKFPDGRATYERLPDGGV